MKLPNLNLLSVPPSPVRAMGGSPVDTREVRYDSSHTPLVGKVRIVPKALVTRGRTCQPGTVLAAGVGPVVEAVEVLLTAVREVPGTITNINDNYCVTECSVAKKSTDSQYSFRCKLLCCQSCTFYNKQCKAATKERLKSSLKKQRNEFCELCFFCRSLCFCRTCTQCPQCCSCSTSRRASSALLADLGPPGSKSKSGVYPEGGLCAPVQSQTPPSETPPDSQWLCQPQQKQVSEGGGSKPSGQKGNRDGEDNSDFPTRRMGDIAGFQRRLFPHPYSRGVPEISQVPFPKPVLPVQGPPLWPLNSSDGVHLCGQRGQVNGSIPGYKDPPVPR